jgi:YVTN family beta-propeller protein
MGPQRATLALCLAICCLAAQAAAQSDGYVGCSTTDNCIPFDLATYTPGPAIDLLPEGDYPYDATINPHGTEVWICGCTGDGVIVIETATNTVSHRIQVGNYLNGVVFTDDGSLALVSSRDDDLVYVVDTSTYTVTGTLDVTTGSGGTTYDGPGNMALDPVSRNIYAVDYYDDTIFEIAPDASSVLRSAEIGNSIWQLVVDPLGRYIYVTDRNTDEVRVIDQVTLSEIRRVAVGDDPWGIDVTLDGSALVVACEDVSSVYVIDTGEWSVTPIQLEAGADPRDVDILDSAGYAYVAGGQATTTGTRVYVIEIGTATLKDAFTPTGGGNANVVAVQAQVTSAMTAVPDGASVAPAVRLDCYPNPFNPALSVTYHLAEASEVELSVYNAAGRLVATLDKGAREAGEHHALWPGLDSDGREAATGVYFVRLEAGGDIVTEKSVLLK